MIILASGSPRRIELLASLGLDFSVHPAEVDETVDSATPPDEAVLELSRRKARHVYATAALPEDTVIAADTLVWQDNRLLGQACPTRLMPRQCCAGSPAAVIPSIPG